MKTETMRIIDRRVGFPVCWVLSWMLPLFVAKPRSGAVVVCKFFGIGSMCLSLPLLMELKKQNREVIYLTFTGNVPMAEFIGASQVLSIDPSSPWRFVRDVVRVIRRMRRLGPSAFLNLEFFSQFAAIMALLSGAPVRSGFHMMHLPMGRLYSHRTNFNVYRHISENFLNVGVRAHMIGEPLPLDQYPDQFTVPQSGSDQGDYILINAESSDTIRDLNSWPVEHWRDLISAIRKQYPGYDVILNGTGDAETLHGEFQSLLAHDAKIKSTVGTTTFDEFVNLVIGAALVITVDSGPLHLSALLKRPTIALFGPETPVLFGHDLPWVRVIYQGLICSPCRAIYDAKQSVLDCQDNQCMKQIRPESVLNEVSALLPR
jgi:ADP-heptose:LPS heptosyltransferase